MAIDQVKLIEEAGSWSADQKVNWSQLARNYGLTGDNGGQSIKEFLAEHNIAAAMTTSSQLVRRRKLRLPGGEISYPTHATVKFQKDVLQKRIDEGEYYMGDPISNAEYTVYHVDKESGSIVESKKSVHGRLISLQEIRSRLLEKHHELGIVRYTDTNIDSMSTAELRTYLEGIHDSLSPECSTADLQSQALKCITTR